MRRPDRVEIAWALVLFATGVALCFVPLFNLLGFEYAFVVGVPACFCGGVLGVRQARATPESPWRSWRDAGLRTSLLVALPLVRRAQWLGLLRSLGYHLTVGPMLDDEGVSVDDRDVLGYTEFALRLPLEVVQAVSTALRDESLPGAN